MGILSVFSVETAINHLKTQFAKTVCLWFGNADTAIASTEMKDHIVSVVETQNQNVNPILINFNGFPFRFTS